MAIGKRLELLKELIPGAALVAVLWDREALPAGREAEAAARERGWRTFPEAQKIAELAARGRLPAMYGLRAHVEAGGLISYGANLSEIWRRAAVFVDKIFKGANPADLPVEQPTKFELVINLKTAKTLGLTIPQSVLLRADELIQ